MKIAFDAKRALLNHSGLGNYSRNLVMSFLHYFPANQYHLFSPKANAHFKKELDEKAHQNLMYHFPQNTIQKRLSFWWRRRLITRQLTKQEINLYHGLSHELPIGIDKTDIKTIVTIHDLIFERYHTYYPWIDRFFYAQKIKHACKIATQIVAISEQTKEDLIHFYHIPADKIKVIYQSCDSVYYQQKALSTPPTRFQLPDQFILCVGTFSQRKNHLSLLKAILLLKKKQQMKIVFVGKGGDCYERIKSFIAENNLQEQVIFIDKCDVNELREIYLAATLLVYPSEFEGFGIPIIEAFASDLPVITTHKSIFKEAGGEAAMYVDTMNIEALANSISDVFNNESLQQEMIAKGRKQLLLFTPEKIANDYMSLYQTIVS